MPKRTEVKLNKRKRGFIRKAIELHDLCGQEIMIQIYDKASNTLVTYQSNEKIGQKAFFCAKKVISSVFCVEKRC